jgi:drug/metabolite transporter (DMT)-like permease
MNAPVKRGMAWALGTAVISGVSVYVNKFGVAQVSDPFIYTTVKNSLVVIGLAAIGLGLARWREMRAFTPRQWAGWMALGLVGGGVPFLLFFQGLASASAPSAALIHKTLFLWVALLAMPLLGERLGGWQAAGLAVLGVGVFLMQVPQRWGWGMGETLILAATLLWAVETIIARKVLAGISAGTAALGRMGVGALVMWGFLAVTGRAGPALALTGTQWLWVAATAVFLLAYVWTWYQALRVAPASLVTSVLVLGAVITTLLNRVLEGRDLTGLQLVAMVLIAAGLAAFALRPARRLPEPAREMA